MQVKIRRIEGDWDDGYALAKHSLSSVYRGENEFGHPQYDTTRSEPGEALYQLKFRSDWSQARPLAFAIAQHIVPRFDRIDIIVPMPASTSRVRQPVSEIAQELGDLIMKPVTEAVLIASVAEGSPKLKDLTTREAKEAALRGRFSVADALRGTERPNVLLLDDLFDSGATMEAATRALRGYAKIDSIYAAAVSWK